MPREEPRVELLRQPPPAPATDLDHRQLELVRAAQGARLVLGPAGSGRTTVLIEALLARLDAGAPAAALLALAPDQPAVRRMRAQLSARAAVMPPAVTTIHAFALDLVTADAATRRTDPPRLLAASDQAAIIGDIMSGAAQGWPPLFEQAVATKHFAERVRGFIARAAVSGWTPDALARADRRPEVWRPIAEVWRDYLRVLALSRAMDYAELLRRATDLLRHSAALPLTAIVVDDFDGLDAAQIRLLAALRPPGCRLLAAADPDQRSDRFRGAATDAVARFAEDFPDASPVAVLDGSYRFGDAIEQVRVRLSTPLPMAGVPASVVRAHRSPRAGTAAGGVDVLHYPDPYAQAAGIAALVRRYALAHTAPGGRPRWRDAAVVARGAAQLDVLEQAFLGAGIPVAGTAAARWLIDEPVVGQLVTGLRIAARIAGLPAPEPDQAAVTDLLVGGLGNCDPVDLRRYLLRLRRTELARSGADGSPPRAGHRLLLAALQDPADGAGPQRDRYPAAARVASVRRRLHAAAAEIAAGAAAAEALWALWSEDARGPGAWAQRLRSAALGAGHGSAAAHRELDAVIGLFAAARRSEARGGGQQVLDFLADLPGLRMPGERLAATADRADAVTLTTAHRARGRQWPLVVVAGVQEGVWPSDLGGLGLLGEELLEDAAATAVGARESHVADERRLFVAACTRAAERLVVTAVAAGERDPSGAQPSRFLADLGVEARAAGRPAGPRTGPVGIVVDLRAAVAAGEPELAQAAADRLALLAADRDYPWAAPAQWWSLARTTRSAQPLVPAGDPVALSVTGLTELDACPWRWFVTRALRAGRPSELHTGIGRLVHRVSEAWANEEIALDLPAAEDLVAGVWPALPFDAPWQSQGRRAEVMAALQRLLEWQRANATRIAFAERSFETDIVLPDGSTIRLRGKADVGIDTGTGALAVLDVKTAKSPPTRADVERHVQLAGYQAAVSLGALTGTQRGSAGAAVLMASLPDATGSSAPKVLWQAPLDLGDSGSAWFLDVLQTASRRLRTEDLPAVESAACRTCPVTALCPAKNPDQGVGA